MRVAPFASGCPTTKNSTIIVITHLLGGLWALHFCGHLEPSLACPAAVDLVQLKRHVAHCGSNPFRGCARRLPPRSIA